jgi:outer membrane lipoprotein-sorting protein
MFLSQFKTMLSGIGHSALGIRKKTGISMSTQTLPTAVCLLPTVPRTLPTAVCLLPTLLLLLIFITTGVHGQHVGYSAIADVAGFKKEFAVQSSKISTITSGFKQEKVLSALTEKITSTGNFRFKRSSKVRLEYTKPFTFLMIMNGDKMIVRDDQKENRVNIRSNKLFQQINRIMIDCIQGSILESKDFNTRVFENDKNYLLEMTPVGKTLKDFFETIVLVVHKTDYSVHSIKMNEPLGDYTTITFTDKRINDQIPDEAFVF